MRTAFFQELHELAKDHNDIVLLTADLGFQLFDEFRAKNPNRFFDVGVAETSMIGIASGLALCGKVVYCYTIIPFLIMRAYEHIRLDAAHHNLNVKLVGVGGGFTYGMEGFTHFGLEDLALMRVLPNMTVVAPADPIEARCLAKISYETQGPMYIRLGKSGDPIIHPTRPDFRLGKALWMTEGKNVAIFAMGSMVLAVIQAREILRKRGLCPTLVNMHTLKPLDKEAIIQIAKTHDIILSVEEHRVEGGLGTAIGEILLEIRYNGFYKKIGIPDRLEKTIGCTDFLRHLYGLSPERIAETVWKTAKTGDKEI